MENKHCRRSIRMERFTVVDNKNWDAVVLDKPWVLREYFCVSG